MLDISDKVKNAYQQDSYPKSVIVRFYGQKSKLYPTNEILPSSDLYPSERALPEHEFCNKDIVSESLSISEGLCEGDTISYRSCVSSALDIEVTNISDDVQDMEVQVLQVIAGATIPLFGGIIDSAKRNGAKSRRKIKAYDYLYYRYKEDMTEWYNSLNFPMKCKDFRMALYRAYNMPYADQELVNDEIYINKADVQEINGRELLQMIGEFNGAFVHMDRNNQIRFVSLDRYNYMYPTDDLLPNTRYPGAQTDAHGFEHAEIYIDCEYGDYQVQEINRLTVREDGNLTASYGGGANCYEITDNILFHGLDVDVLHEVLVGIYTKIGGIYYVPHKTVIKGRPYVECGDVINVKISDSQTIDTYVFRRTLKGVQSLRDTYEADGEEYHNKLYEVEEWTE